MRRCFSFRSLTVQRHVDNVSEKDAVFFAMRNMVRSWQGSLIGETPEAALSFLPDGPCYIAHDLVVRKGRSVFFKGELVVALRADLRVFLETSIAQNDVRTFLMAPLFSDCPEYVLRMEEDVVFLLYRNGEGGTVTV